MVRSVEFEWDLAKDNENIRKHGVSFAETVESFLDPQGFQLTDSKHSGSEKRWYWIGRLATGRVLTTRFTKRGKTIRIIGSAEWRKFGDSIMKQPNLRRLKIDRKGTDIIRNALRKKGRVTITVNLDAADLRAQKTRSKKAGLPYQRLLKTLLTTTVSQQESIQSRLARLEQELRKIKRHVAV